MSYTKTTWSDGDIITANKMNNIETGVESLNTDVGQLQTDLDSLTETVENLPTGGGDVPADYQELVDDVSQIKADLSELAETDKTLSVEDKPADAKAVGDIINPLGQSTVTLEYTTVPDEWVLSTGIIQNKTGWSRTDYIDLTNVMQFKTNINTNYASYFDKDKNPKGAISVRNNVYNEVPVGAAYAMVSQTTTAMGNLVITAVKRGALEKLEYKIVEIQESIDNINVETDTTLSESGKPADAKAVGDKIQEVNRPWINYYGTKGAIYCIECSDIFTFGIGTIINGVPTDADKKKVKTESFVTLDYDLILKPFGNIRFGVVCYDSTGESMIKDSGWQTNEYVVPAGQKFKIVVAGPRGGEVALQNKHELLQYLYIVDSYYSLQSIVDNTGSNNKNALYKLPFMQSAHRGIRTTILPANTEIAFLEAAKNGLDAVELDVRKTGDNVLIISHDSFVKGTLNGETVQLTIADETYDTLKQIVLTNHYAYGDLTICTLEEALNIMWKYGMFCFIDHKINIPLETAEMVKQFNLEGKAFYSNFTITLETINSILEIDPLARFSSQYYEPTLEYLKNADVDMSKFAIWCPVSSITSEIRNKIKNYGCRYLLSGVTINDIDKMINYRPDIVEYATLSYPEIKAIQKAFRDA